jgi:peptidoglycan/LPS O-acetylase OafA/YrhL
MGRLRFLLAAAVVIGHAPGWGGIDPSLSFYGLRFLHPYYAVQAFFAISGFYMAVVLSEKYNRLGGGTWVFYANRYLRLAPTFWLVSLVTLGLIVAFPAVPFPAADLVWGRVRPEFHAPCRLDVLYLVVANFTMFGHDLTHFFQTYKTFPVFGLVPQAWSIGTELWFYLLAPLLVGLRGRRLLALAAGSVACRFATIGLGLPFWPWQQRFFPSELFFFLAGVLAYRCYRLYQRAEQPWVLHPWVCRAAVAAACALVALVGWVKGAQHLSVWFSLGLGAVCFALLPLVFHATRAAAWDRFVGELSYPMYLWHCTIAYYCHPAQVYGRGGVLLLLTVLVSLPTVLLLERPVERWRQSLVRRRRPLALPANAAAGAAPSQAA